MHTRLAVQRHRRTGFRAPPDHLHGRSGSAGFASPAGLIPNARAHSQCLDLPQAQAVWHGPSPASLVRGMMPISPGVTPRQGHPEPQCVTQSPPRPPISTPAPSAPHLSSCGFPLVVLEDIGPQVIHDDLAGKRERDSHPHPYQLGDPASSLTQSVTGPHLSDPA